MTTTRLLRWSEAAVVGVAWFALLLGVALAPLTFPSFTERLVLAQGAGARTGLGDERALELAQAVRAYVTEPGAEPLPRDVDGRPGFDEAMVSHLDDVRDVFLGARVATGVLAAALAAWVLASIGRRRWRALADGLRVGGWLTIGAPFALGLLGVLDFELLFTLFHGLFFAAGTWTFPYDSLLIQLFPEPFWVTAAAVWAMLAVVGGAALVAASARIPREGE